MRIHSNNQIDGADFSILEGMEEIETILKKQQTTEEQIREIKQCIRPNIVECIRSAYQIKIEYSPDSCMFRCRSYLEDEYDFQSYREVFIICEEYSFRGTTSGWYFEEMVVTLEPLRAISPFQWPQDEEKVISDGEIKVLFLHDVWNTPF